jgi:coenzyme PQQ synthesis protein D (PqqD)
MKDTGMLDSSTVVRRNERVEYRDLGDGEGGVLLHLDTAAYHGVNEVGAMIWTLLEGITVQQLLDEVRSRLNSTPPSLEKDVEEFLQELAERDLVSYDAGTESG